MNDYDFYIILTEEQIEVLSLWSKGSWDYQTTKELLEDIFEQIEPDYEAQKERDKDEN